MKNLLPAWQKIFIDTLFKDMKDYVRSFELCQLSKPAGNTIGLMSSKPAERTFERLHIDLFLVRYHEVHKISKSHMRILICIDQFCKLTWVIPLRNDKTEGLIRALNEDLCPEMVSHLPLSQTTVVFLRVANFAPSCLDLTYDITRLL